MSEVKRFKPVINSTPYKPYAYCEENEDGIYVRIDDYEAIKAERDALADKLAHIEDYCIGVDTEGMEFIDKCNALAAEMSVMDAIRDNCVFITDDDYDACPKSVQEIIRSLAVMKIPATNTYLNSVRAAAIVEAASRIAAQVWEEDEGAGMVAAIDALAIIEQKLRAGEPS
jgi:hypothetical protein